MKKDSLFDKIEDILLDYISHVELELRDSNKKDKKIYIENKNLIRKSENIKQLLDGNKIDGLSKEECDIFVEILSNQVDLKMLEYEAIFFNGVREAISFMISK